MHLRRNIFAAFSLAAGLALLAPQASAGATTGSAPQPTASMAALIGAPAMAQEPWAVPPRELNEFQRQGVHDGVEGARRDFENHRPPNVENRDEYRHPHLPPEQREAYRDGFRRGYNMAISHLMGGPGPGYQAPPPPPPVVRGDWDTVPTEFNDWQRQGFHDGIDGARHDFENHRPPNVENRDEYRHPHVPPAFFEAYREGFRRGYNRAMAHLSGRQWEY